MRDSSPFLCADASLFTTSWDDGHPLDLKLAEVLARHGVAGAFYVPVRNRADRPVMTAAELRRLAAMGFEIGSHTLDHRRLSGLSREEASRQMADGRAALEDVLGRPVTGFCFPGGRIGRWGAELARELGFTHARTTQMLRFDAGSDPLAVPTTAQIFPHRSAALWRNWLRHGGGVGRLAALRTLAIPPGADPRPALAAALSALPGLVPARNGLLHLWGHSWEIEAHDLWRQLEDALSAAAAVFPPERRVDNRTVADRTLSKPELAK